MRPLLRNKLATVLILFMSGALAHAHEGIHKESSGEVHKKESSEVKEDTPVLIEAPCGILESFSGNLQILDSTRSHLLETNVRSPIPCGSWVSVSQGWAQIRHQNGPHVHLGSQTFIQLVDFRKDDQFKDDHLVLYKGQVYVQAGNGEEEFRLVSSGGRARVKRGKIIFIFNTQDDETQLIALENSATLENRFEPTRKIKVHDGEATELNFNMVRVVPGLPRALSISSLKPKLTELRVLESDQYELIQTALRRQDRKLAMSLNGDEEEQSPRSKKKNSDKSLGEESHSEGRKPASIVGSKESYLRHEPSTVDAALHDHWVKKMVGEEQVGERILYPDKFYGKSQRVSIEIEDPTTRGKGKKNKVEDVEKKRLIEELSKIRME